MQEKIVKYHRYIKKYDKRINPADLVNSVADYAVRPKKGNYAKRTT